MLQHRRRKKPLPPSQQAQPAAAATAQRPVAQHGGVRSVELSRGRHGYGFTVSGQRPCTLSSIVQGSPADAAGLRDGDQLLAVNGTAAAQLSHEHVVRLVASSADSIKLLLADGVRQRGGERTAKTAAAAGAGGELSDTSDEYDDNVGYGAWPVPSAHTPRHRPRSQSQTKLASGRARSQSPGNALQQQQQQQQQQRSSADARRTRGGAGKPRRATPTTAAATAAAMAWHRPSVVQATGGRASDFGVAAAVRSGGFRSQRNGGATTTTTTAVAAAAAASAAAASATFYGGRALPRSTSVPDVSRQDDGDGELSLRGKEGRASALATRQPQQSLCAIVGYIGTIEIPPAAAGRGGGAGGALQLQAVRSAVRRLRVEQKVHTLVLLAVRSDGVHLHGTSGITVAHYPRHALIMCGAYCDDERFFSLVTAPDAANAAGDGYDDDEEEEAGSSCHVFMVDPALSQHSAHANVAQQFGGLGCCDATGAAGSCSEFPRSCAPILCAISALSRDGVGVVEAAKGLPAAAGAAPVSQTRACLGSGTDTDSDSGLGRNSRVRGVKSSSSEAYVVSVDIPAEVSMPEPTASGYIASGVSIVKPVGQSSLLTMSRADGSSSSGGRSSSSNGSAQPRPAAAGDRQAPAALPASVAGSGGGDPRRPGIRSGAAASVSPAVFNIRAKADDSPLLERSSAASLRRNMQRLMEARKSLVRDTHSLSDTESLASVRSTGSSFVPATISSPGNSDSSRTTSSAAGRSAASRELPPPARSSLSAAPVVVASRLLSSSCETLSTPASAWQCGGDGVRGRSVPDRATAVAADGRRGGFGGFGGGAPTTPEWHDAVAEPAPAERQHGKLSPRAYPELAARRAPSVVRLSECSAFDKVTSHDTLGSGLQQQPQQLSRGAAACAAAQAQKPVPAPRSSAPSRLALSAALGKAAVQETVAAANRADAGNWSVHAAAPADPRCSSVPPTGVSAAAAGTACTRVGGSGPARLDVIGRASVTGAQPKSLIDPQHGFASGVGGLASGISAGINGTAAVSAGRATVDAAASADIGRVTRWALGLDKLLQDESGIAVFTDFLKKEHSEENIAFWLACERFRRAPQQEKIGLAREIFHTHLSPRGAQAVNVDSAACLHAQEQLAAPTEDMFDEAQKQVFHLMKMDCYARFLKSDLYKNCIVADMEEHRLSDASAAATNAKVFRDDASEESSDASETRRRRSLLLFLKESAKTLARNADMLSRSRSSDADFLLKKQSAKQSAEQPAVHGKLLQQSYPRHAGLGTRLASTDLEPHSVREEADVIIVQSSSEDDGLGRANGDGRRSAAATPRMRQQQQQQWPRVRHFVMPDGSAAEVDTAESGADTMRTIVEKLCARHGVPVASVEVLAIGSDRPLDLSRKLSEMDPGAEFIMERRAVFRLEMPKRKSVAVRAKPQRLVLDVLRPLLHKYGYGLRDVTLYLDGQVLANDAIISTIDSRRVSVHERSDSEVRDRSADWGGRVGTHRLLSKTSSTGGAQRSRVGAAEDSDGSCSDQRCSSDGSSGVEDVVDFEKAAFEERVRGGGLLGRLRPASASEDRGQKAKRKNKVHFAPSKPISPTSADEAQSVNDDDGLHLLELITKAQGTRYDDQRGARVLVGELPAFLLQPSIGSDRGRDVDASEATANPNARGTRHSFADVFSQQQTYLQHDLTSALSASTFSADCRLPTHEEAEALFGSARPDLGGSPRTTAAGDAATGALADDGDDDRTPTRQPPNSSYRAELLVARANGGGDQMMLRGGGGSSSNGGVGMVADDQSWYRPHWDSKGVGDDDDCECETEASTDAERDGEEEEAEAAAGAFDPDRTLIAADGAVGTDSSSGDLSLTAAAACYLPPPSPFENASETSSAAAAGVAAAATPSRPSVPPPYSMAVARSLALATAAGGSTTPPAAVAAPPAAIPSAAAPAPTAPTRPSRSSTLPGSRLSYASRPLIVDDDGGGGIGRSDDFVDARALLHGKAVASFAAAAEAFRSSAGLVHAVPLPAADYGGSRKHPTSARPLPPSGGTAAHLLPQYGFYQDVQNSAQQATALGSSVPAHRGGLPSFGAAAVQSAGSKITFV